MQENQTAGQKGMLGEFMALKPVEQQRISVISFSFIPHPGEGFVERLALTIFLPQMEGDTIIALAREIAQDYGVKFRECSVFGEGDSEVRVPAFHVCFRNRPGDGPGKVAYWVKMLIQAEGELNKQISRTVS